MASYLHIGDLICLRLEVNSEEEDRQFVGSVGFFGHEQVGVTSLDDTSDKHNHVFLVRQQHSYLAASALRKKLEVEGVDIEQVCRATTTGEIA